MKFQLTVRQKLGSAIGQESEAIPCTNISPDGTFEAQMLGFARRDCNAYITAWVNGRGMKVRAWMKPLFQWFVPAVILFIYIYGLITFGWK